MNSDKFNNVKICDDLAKSGKFEKSDIENNIYSLKDAVNSKKLLFVYIKKFVHYNTIL